jgi:hypothetical protein
VFVWILNRVDESRNLPDIQEIATAATPRNDIKRPFDPNLEYYCFDRSAGNDIFATSMKNIERRRQN